MLNQLQWKLEPFSKLSPNELYAILRLRNEVFVVEQNCVYLDTDNKDQHCYHLSGWDGDQLVAYARLLPPQLAWEEMSIGRVISSPAYRRTGAGKQLIAHAIEAAHSLYGKGPIRIGAQLYLKDFYAAFGFTPCSEEYLEDDIPHIEMMLMLPE